jgi:hypothetical protein
LSDAPRLFILIVAMLLDPAAVVLLATLSNTARVRAQRFGAPESNLKKFRRYEKTGGNRSRKNQTQRKK